MKTLGLLLILLLMPYRIASGISTNAVHTWIMSLFWHMHFDRVKITFYFTIQITLVLIFLMIIIPAMYFYIALQRRCDDSFQKIPIMLSILAPLILDFCISIEDEIAFPFSLSRYEWLTLYSFSLAVIATMVFIPLMINRIPITIDWKTTKRRQFDSRYLRPRIEAIIIAISVIALPSGIVGIGRMFTHYTYNEMVLYGPLWSAIFWERSGAFYAINEFVLEIYRIPSLVIALLSSFFNIVFAYKLFRNYGKMHTRIRTLILGIVGMVSMTLSYYIMTLFSPDIQRMYVFAFPLPFTLILGLLVLKFGYPKYTISSTMEAQEIDADDTQEVESDEVLEISIVYRLASWLRKRI